MSRGHYRRTRGLEVPLVVIDYMWMTEEEGDEEVEEDMRGMPILVAIGEYTDWMGA